MDRHPQSSPTATAAAAGCGGNKRMKLPDRPRPSFPSGPFKAATQPQAPLLRRCSSTREKAPPAARLPVTLYITSLQGIRRTFDDCRAVRSILRGFRVAVDERDLAMDLSFRRELHELLGGSRPFSLPQAFVGRRWLGGADEIRRLHEDGELGRALQGVSPEDRDACFVCHACGGARFVPCLGCRGSRKLFLGDLRRCPLCNENGLVRCANCSSPV